GETPHEACMREVREELGIEPSIGRLLLTAWTRSSEIGDRIYFIFDGGVLDSRTRTVISLDRQELSEHGFFSATEAPRRLPFWLAGLVSTAMQSGADGTSRYVELTLTPR
ncbi:MAG: NUDIX domain-containing protein, partial [Mycobacteriales bacterium]